MPYGAELRIVKEKLQCAQHAGPNRWCYVSPDKPSEHVALGYEEITLWARKIVCHYLFLNAHVQCGYFSMTTMLIPTVLYRDHHIAFVLMTCANELAASEPHQGQRMVFHPFMSISIMRRCPPTMRTQLQGPAEPSNAATR